jgi:misacylated tRNA(Ala) deacylase
LYITLLIIFVGDPLRRSVDTTVVSAEVYKPPPSDAGKKGKKAVVAPTLPPGLIILVTLHDTVIFPEGGGQPTDTGLITTRADGKQWEVVQCKRHGGYAIHYVRVQEVATDDALAAFAPGASVTAELGGKDFERRYDHVRAKLYLQARPASENANLFPDVDAHITASSLLPT